MKTFVCNISLWLSLVSWDLRCVDVEIYGKVMLECFVDGSRLEVNYTTALD